MINLQWFLSAAVRHGGHLYRHVRKMLNAQRDILAPEAVRAVEQSLDQTRQTLRQGAERERIEEELKGLEAAAIKHLKPYPSASLRENVEVLLVAIALAMGIRTFFLQPFKIPTGSMQPTLFGITEENLIEQPDYKLPNAAVRFAQYWFNGISYKHVVARGDGALNDAEAPRRFLLFNLKQRFRVGSEWYTVWFPPDNLLERAGLISRGMRHPHTFRKGEDILKLKVISGDHLFVDRLTYNFRRPHRGDIVVFETKGIPSLSQDQFYIKRLIGLGGETVQIGDDRHVVINGTNRLNAATPGFEHVYSFTGPPRSHQYSGHLNDTTARDCGLGGLAPNFPDADTKFPVRPGHYLVMGDNTLHSSDSRTWGDFPQENVIGKAYFVYWPIGSQDGRGSRFGWSYR